MSQRRARPHDAAGPFSFSGKAKRRANAAPFPYFMIASIGTGSDSVHLPTTPGLPFSTSTTR